MSEWATRWARVLTATPSGAPLTGQEAHLLLLLASYHSEIAEGGYWPTVSDLAAMLRLGERQTQRLLHDLEKKGCMTRDTRGGRGRGADYTLMLPVKGDVQESPLLQKGDIKGDYQMTPIASGAKERVTSDAVKGDIKGDISSVSERERVTSAVPDGGTIGGSTPVVPVTPVPGVTEYEDRGTSPTLPTVAAEITARAGGKTAKRVKSVEDVTADLIAEYADRWPEADVRDRIAYALSYRTSKNWTVPELGLRRWLKKDAADEDARPRAGPSPPATANRNGQHSANGREGPQREQPKPAGQQSDFAFFRRK